MMDYSTVEPLRVIHLTGKIIMAQEIELKLEVAGKDADAIEASGLLVANHETIRQHSIYFDTPDHQLSKAGLSLRIRRSGERRIQTVKAVGTSAAGLFARSEWEIPVRDDTPTLNDATPVQAVLGDTIKAISPAFEVEVQRRVWRMSESGATIELVLDRGNAIAGDRRSAICEIELELKQGGPAALFMLARRLDTVAPVRLGVVTKAERGYRLIGPVVKMVKAEPILLAGDTTIAQAFRRITQSCLRQFRLNESFLLTESRPDPDALHQARVALRRLRSAFAIFRPTSGDSGADLLSELRQLAAQLGEARNLDILLERSNISVLHDQIVAAREAAYSRVGDTLGSPKTRGLMLDLAELAADVRSTDAASTENAAQNGSAAAFAVTTLDRLRRKLRENGRDLVRADDEKRHEVRKAAKRLRYAAEFFASLFPRKRQKRRYKRFVAALAGLQDQLGTLNDLATAPHVLGMIGVPSGVAARALLTDNKSKLLSLAEDAFEEFFDTSRFWN